MKLALVFILVFVTMSYQQQFQKKFYWAGENNQQKDQPSGIYNYNPFTIRSYLSPMDPADEGMVGGLLPHQATMLVRNEIGRLLLYLIKTCTLCIFIYNWNKNLG